MKVSFRGQIQAFAADTGGPILHALAYTAQSPHACAIWFDVAACDWQQPAPPMFRLAHRRKFIATPPYRLCLACVAAIEASTQTKTAEAEAPAVVAQS